MNNNNRLGCLTGTGLIAGLVTLSLLVVIVLLSGAQLFSPGELNSQPGETIGGVNSHAQIAECNTCHTSPLESATMADRCLDCHKDIAAQMLDVAKLHGSIAQKTTNFACRACHHEHRGETAALTDISGTTFPHDTFGFSLNKHKWMRPGTPITCEDCHTTDITTFASDSCQTCHSDIDSSFTQAHVLAFGTDCIACHDGVDRFEDFNHNAYSFNLDGKHTEVPCEQCHLDARSLADLQSAPRDCYSCHKQDDVHNGENGNDCQTCHNTSNWEAADFDHGRAGFPLTGGHANVDCEQCHTNGTFKGISATCSSCHQDPSFHAGVFGTDCQSCHSIQAWSPAKFNLSHPEPRVGEGGNGINHGRATCQQCHPTSVREYTCDACHRGGFEGGGHGGDD